MKNTEHGDPGFAGLPQRRKRRSVGISPSRRTHSHSARFPLLPLRTTKEQIEKRGQKGWGAPRRDGLLEVAFVTK